MAEISNLRCGCEVREGRLMSVCALHGEYTRQHVEKARARPEGVDKELQRQLVVAIAPIVVSKSLPTHDDADIGEKVHNTVHEIMRRMD